MNKNYFDNNFLLVAGFFIFGLHVTYLSQIVIIILACYSILKGKKRLTHPQYIQFYFLLWFLITYYITLYSFCLVTLQQSVNRILVIFCAYALGATILTSIKKRDLQLIFLLIALHFGFCVVSFWSVIENVGFDYGSMLSSYRVNIEMAFGKNDALIAGPTFGMLSSFGFSFLPILFFLEKNIMLKKHIIIIRIAILAMFLMSLYTNAILQNRLPFIIFLTSYFFLALFSVYCNKSILIKIKKVSLCLFLGCCLYYILFIVNANVIADYSIYNRFSSKGIETPRFTKWITMINSMPYNLWGGRGVDLGPTPFAHNFWLDIFYDAGVVPFLLIISFHTIFIKKYIKFFKSKLNIALKYFIIALSVSYTFTYIAEPTIQGSYVFFAASCFLIGIINALADDFQYPAIYRRN